MIAPGASRSAITEGVEAAHGPADERQSPLAQQWMHEEVFHPYRRTEHPRRGAGDLAQHGTARVDLAAQPRWRKAPERSAGVCLRMVADGVAARDDFADALRVRRGQ
jgi:hypothetical protein